MRLLTIARPDSTQRIDSYLPKTCNNWKLVIVWRMATAQQASASSSSTILEQEQPRNQSPTLRLKLRKPKHDKKVKWTTETVDNEHMNKKKSKCCCQYQKPKMFGESSSEDEDDCKSCSGHKDKCFRTGDDESGHGNGPIEGGSSEHWPVLIQVNEFKTNIPVCEDYDGKWLAWCLNMSDQELFT